MMDLIGQIMNEFKNYDLNYDNKPAINSLSYVSFESAAEEIPQDGKLVLVLVESRLLEPLAGSMDIVPSLRQFKKDIRAEGLYSRFISADVYRGTKNQDGRTILALRSFLKEIKIRFTNFKGVILVGSFPEATLIRKAMWAPSFKGTKIGNIVTTGEKFLAIVPELTSTRSDIVLADLTGNWQSIYHEEPVEIEAIWALPDAATAAKAWPVNGEVFTSNVYTREMRTFKDVFCIEDADYDVLGLKPNELRLHLRHQQRHPEISAQDRSSSNPIACPDIIISRINTRNVAENPDPSIKGDDGTKPLDALGHPQAFVSTKPYNTGSGMFKQDQVFERQLICDYFERNHKFRKGYFSDLPFRAASITQTGFNAQHYANEIAKASNDFEAPVVKQDASLLDLVKWFKQPAALRHICAHSNSTFSTYPGAYDKNVLEAEAGGHPFRWKRSGNNYTPSFEDQGDHADWYLYRTIWQNNILDDKGANLIINMGCEVMAVDGENRMPQAHYYQEEYASFQNAESMLFYMNGVAMIARAKVFNDDPTGFAAALGNSNKSCFGDGWIGYYGNEANDGQLANFDKAIRCKKAYFWSLIGDWTVRLNYTGGIGILGYTPQFNILDMHTDHTWIGAWNFNALLDNIKLINDFDGDNITEFLVTSPWGIGILKRDTNGWTHVLAVPNGTRFGGWLVNTLDNKFSTAGDFDGDGKAEILVTSPWGMSIMNLAGNTLSPIMMEPNGTRLGDWLLDTKDNKFNVIGDFNGDGKDEILVTSPWGISIMSLTGNKLNPVFMAQNGTRFDGWLLNTSDNSFKLVGDFDGDGKDEILVTSPWGICIMKLSGNTLKPIVIAENGTRFGGWLLNTSDNSFKLTGDFDGDGKAEILVSSPWGMGILELSLNKLVSLVMMANGTKIGTWTLNTKYDSFAAGDFDGDKLDEIFVYNANKIGILHYNKNTLFCPDSYNEGTHMGNWILSKNDRVIGVGNFDGSNKKHILIQKGK